MNYFVEGMTIKLKDLEVERRELIVTLRIDMERLRDLDDEINRVKFVIKEENE